MSTSKGGAIFVVLMALGGCAQAPPKAAEIPVPSIEAPSKPHAQLTDEPEASEPTVSPASSATSTASTLTDSDKDGIPDAEDRCPYMPGPPSSDPSRSGCPRIAPYRSEIRILTTISFSNGDAGIAKTNNALIAEVAKALLEHPEFKRVQMSGHAARGEPNGKLLSEKRAKAVLKALMTAGVDAARLVAVGKGDTQPIDTNDTAEGRARNSRVEFQILEGSESPR